MLYATDLVKNAQRGVAQSEKARILIVEDDRTAAMLQLRRLEMAGYSVVAVQSRIDALEAIVQHQIDLLILDYFLGESFTGLALFEELKSMRLEVPTILVTGGSHESVIIAALRAGVRDFVTKSADYLDYLVGAVERVLRQANLERRLDESEGRLASIVNSARDAIVTVEQDLRIGIFNSAAEDVFRCPAEEAVGQPISRFIPAIVDPVHETGGADWWIQHCAGIPSVLRTELVGRRAGGKAFPLEASISKANHRGGAAFFTLILRDITERKRAEEALRRAHADLENRARELVRSNAQLMRSNQELDDFAYVASHDLKEPLRGISNYASFIIEDYADKLDDEGRAKLQTLQNLSNRLGVMIDSMLEFSRVARVDMAMQETDLNEVVKEVIESLRISLDELQVAVRIPRPLPTVTCNHSRIGEVFRNLITNAMKYNDKPEKWIEIGWETQPRGDAPQAPVFYVRDNGIGIAARHLDTVFRIFKRLHGRDRFGGGTGVGLAIVKKVVERHNGRIWIDSTVGKGTTFYFTLG